MNGLGDGRFGMNGLDWPAIWRCQHSIRINDRYRICFFWNRGQPVAVAITDYHR